MKPYRGVGAGPSRRLKAAARLIVLWPVSPDVAYTLGEPIFRLLGMRRTGEEFGLSQAKRVLVVRLDEIGDVLMTTPFLRELRRNAPAAWITLIVKPGVYNLVELCPYVNEVLMYDWNIQGVFGPYGRHGRALALAWERLWHRRFDLAILPRWDGDWYHGAFVAYFSGAPRRVGYSENVNELKRRFNRRFNRLFTHLLDDRSLKHEVERNLDIIRFLGGTVKADHLEVWLSDEDEAFARQILATHGFHLNELLIALGPGAPDPKRMWPLDNFLELSRWLSGKLHARIVVVGGEGEESLGQALQGQLGRMVVNVVGQTTLRQAGALLRCCRLFIGNDVGPMHLAAAAGVPVVEISCHAQDGPPLHYHSPTRFAPWGVPHHVLQPERALDPCSGACTASQAHCICGVGVEQVREAVVAQLSRQGGSALLGSVSEPSR